MKLERNSNSQAGQESFVLDTLKRKKFGFYLEIGAFHSKQLSNTYLLENRYKWSGVSFEIDRERIVEFRSNRKNPIVEADATCCDYETILRLFKAPKRIDYLQVDIEPAKNTVKALLKVLASEFEFSIVTFEHDIYASKRNLWYKWVAYCNLRARGYTRVASNIRNDGYSFEDWYVHKSLSSSTKKFRKNSNWQALFEDDDNYL